jgi:hypothetical protein
MAKKFTKSNMYDWITNQTYKKEVEEIDAQVSPLLARKTKLLKLASQEYKAIKRIKDAGKEMKNVTPKQMKDAKERVKAKARVKANAKTK